MRLLLHSQAVWGWKFPRFSRRCSSGGIGIRARLRILWLHGLGGSSPPLSIDYVLQAGVAYGLSAVTRIVGSVSASKLGRLAGMRHPIKEGRSESDGSSRSRSACEIRDFPYEFDAPKACPNIATGDFSFSKTHSNIEYPAGNDQTRERPDRN